MSASGTRNRTPRCLNGRDPLTASTERISLNRKSIVGVIRPNTQTAGPSRTPQSKIERRTKWTIALPVGCCPEVHDILSAISVISAGDELTDTSGSRRDQVIAPSFYVQVRESENVGVPPPTPTTTMETAGVVRTTRAPTGRLLAGVRKADEPWRLPSWMSARLGTMRRVVRLSCEFVR
jgi:hypothetical protein